LPAQDYNQPYRPQFHFSPQQNWTNDPNGLVYFEGKYHLFFQYNPFGDSWGHMSWGHAVSLDLVHWQELPVALPEADGLMIFTGSTVVDQHNTSGFCTNGRPCLVAIYTGHTPGQKNVPAGKPPLQTQNLAFSNDRGRTWTKFSGNPVLNLNMSDFRDPGVFWSDQAKHWVMAVSLPDDHKVRFYGSSNLKSWNALSDFGPAGATAGQWECPDLFEAPVENSNHEKRWVLKVGLNPGGLQGGSGEQYFIGRFDGTRFVNDNPPGLALWSDYGKDCYCALTFNGLPPDQKPAMLGWMNNWQYAGKVPTSPWRGQMTVPRRVSLKRFADGIGMVQQPVEALRQLREKHLSWQGERLIVPSETFEVESTMQLGQAEQIGWKIRSGDAAYTLISYDSRRRELFVDRTHSGQVGFSNDFAARTAAPVPATSGPVNLHILVDRSSIEVFAQNGRIAFTNLIFPAGKSRSLELQVSGGRPGQVTAEAWTLKSIH
jgi:sucrose-6-phosphate hydrolase SacC (GH32 family)